MELKKEQKEIHAKSYQHREPLSDFRSVQVPRHRTCY